MAKQALQTIYSTFEFRPPGVEEREQRLWSTLFYYPILEAGPFDTETEALDRALQEWEAEEYQLPFLVRYATVPGFLGGVQSGWCVYYLDLVPVKELSRIKAGSFEAYVKTLAESPFNARADAVKTARWNWRKEQGRIGMTVAREVLEKHVVLDRRLTRSKKLAIR